MTGVAYAPPPRWPPSSGRSRANEDNCQAHAAASCATTAAAAHGESGGYEGLSTTPVPLDHASLPRSPTSLPRAQLAWDRALELGEAHATANAQATVIAPPARSASSWIATERASSPTSRSSSSRSSPAAAYFKIINRAVPDAFARIRLPEHEIPRSRSMRSAKARSGQGPG